jgi:peroxiredoxin
MRLPVLFIALSTLVLGCGPSTTPSPNSGGVDAPDEAPESSGGPSAPDFTLPTLDGDTISLSDYEGDKVVLIDFWATTCDPCLAEMGELVELYKAKKGEGLEILAISTDGPQTRSQVTATVSKRNMIFPILLDEETEVMDRYNPKGALPFTAVIDRSGAIVLKRVGYQAGDEKSWKQLVAAVESALAK